MLGAPPHRRLVEGSGEAARRQCGQHAHIAWPGHPDKVAGGAAHMRQLGVMAEAVKRPVERAQQPGHAVMGAGARRAPPLHRGVEEPHPGEIERAGDGRDLIHIRRARAREPALRNPVERRHQRMSGARQGAEARITERRAFAGFSSACRGGPPSRTSTSGIAGKTAFKAALKGAFMTALLPSSHVRILSCGS